MEIQDRGSIGEVVAALATVGTLFYLAVQIRANTNQVRGQAIIGLNEAGRDFVSRLQDNPRVNEIIMKASDDFLSCTAEEQRFANALFIEEFSYHEMAFLLLQQKAIDEQFYVNREGHLLSLLKMPGRRYWWDHVDTNLDPRFKRRIAERLQAEGDKVKPFDTRLPVYIKDGE